MTIMTIKYIRERIKVASKASPIAVFALEKGDPEYDDRYSSFDVCFASTVISKKLIDCARKERGKKLIGVYTVGSLAWFDADIFELEVTKGLG